MNYSLITNIAALAPFMTALVFYFLFKERLDAIYLVGIVLILICAFLTTLASSVTQLASDSDETYSPALPITLTIIATIFHAFISAMTRHIVNTTNMNVFQVIADSYIQEGILFLILFIHSDYSYSMILFWEIAGLQCISMIAYALLFTAIAYGKAAPSQALYDTATIYLLILEAIYSSDSFSSFIACSCHQILINFSPLLHLLFSS